MSIATRDTAFRDKSALVTGGASGIGLELCRQLQAAGARVVLADLDERAAIAAHELTATERSQHDVVGVEFDVRDRARFQQVVDLVRDQHGHLDLLFNNAGITRGGPTHRMAPVEWDRIIDVNIRGVVHGIDAALPGMVERGSGRIVNTASAAGLMAAPFTAGYSMSKFAVVGLSEALRPEAARHGISVTVLCPGMVETPILDEPPTEASGALTPRSYLQTIGLRPIPADSFARTALDAVAKNKPLVVTPTNVKIGWWFSRHSPRLHRTINRAISRRVDNAMTRREPDRNQRSVGQT